VGGDSPSRDGTWSNGGKDGCFRDRCSDVSLVDASDDFLNWSTCSWGVKLAFSAGCHAQVPVGCPSVFAEGRKLKSFCAGPMQDFTGSEKS